MDPDLNDTVYELIKEQCMSAFLAESRGRSDLAVVSPQAQILLNKVNELLNSQQVALTSLVSISLSKTENQSENIFSTTTKNQYGKFIFLLTVVKLLTSHFYSEHKDTAKLIVGEIQTVLNDTAFKSLLYDDPDYQKLVAPPQNQEEVKQPVNTSYQSYIGYGVGTLLVGAVGVLAFSFARNKK